MIRKAHLHALPTAPGFEMYQFPSLTTVLAAPQPRRLDIDDVFVGWIENEKLRHAPKIEHAPRLTTVMSNVGSGHVAGDQHGVRIMWADLGTKHGAATARPHDIKVTGALSEDRSCQCQ